MKTIRTYSIISLCGALIAGIPAIAQTYGQSPGMEADADHRQDVEHRQSIGQYEERHAAMQSPSEKLREAGLDQDKIQELARNGFEQEEVEDAVRDSLEEQGKSEDEARIRAEVLSREVGWQHQGMQRDEQRGQFGQERQERRGLSETRQDQYGDRDDDSQLRARQGAASQTGQFGTQQREHDSRDSWDRDSDREDTGQYGQSHSEWESDRDRSDMGQGRHGARGTDQTGQQRFGTQERDGDEQYGQRGTRERNGEQRYGQRGTQERDGRAGQFGDQHDRDDAGQTHQYGERQLGERGRLGQDDSADRQGVDDQRNIALETQVRERLRSDYDLDLSQADLLGIQIEARDDTVKLRGSIRDEDKKDRIKELVEGMDEVDSVENEIDVE